MAESGIPKELPVFRRWMLPVFQGGNHLVKLPVVADSFRLRGRRRKRPFIQVDLQALPVFFPGVPLNRAVQQPAPMPARNRVAELRLEILKTGVFHLAGRGMAVPPHRQRPRHSLLQLYRLVPLLL